MLKISQFKRPMFSMMMVLGLFLVLISIGNVFAEGPDDDQVTVSEESSPETDGNLDEILQDKDSSDDSPYEVIELQEEESIEGIRSPNENLFAWTRNAGWHRGKVKIRYYNRNIEPDSVVMVEASQGYYNNRHMGDAKFTVHNVVPKSGYVEVLVEIDWHNRLPLALDFLWLKR